MERNDLALVVAIREGGSLAAAARALNTTPSAVTKRLAALEATLGQRLFQRTTRRVSATSEGDTLCDRARVLLQGFNELEAELQERKIEPTGAIRLAATFGFGRLWLGPALAEFQARYPRIDIELQLTELLPDLARDRFDGAIWLWSVQGQRASDWVSRRLARNQRVLVAAPAYLRQHGAPKAVDDLPSHTCLIVRENGHPVAQEFALWHLHKLHGKDGGKAKISARVQGPLSSNSGELVRDWCLSGRGIMLRSLWDIAPQLASGQLVRVLPGYAMPDADIHWLAPYRAEVPRRIRLLIDFLVAAFEAEPWKTNATPACLTARPD